jgi:hypothetical protein
MAAKLNYERTRRQHNRFENDRKLRSVGDILKAQNRTAKKRAYCWWTQSSDGWVVAVDGEYTIGPERIITVKKANGQKQEYMLIGSAISKVEYEGGHYETYKVKKI